MNAASTAATTLRADARVIGLVSVAHLLSHFYQLVIPPLFLQMKEAFGLGYTELGFAMAAFYVASGALQTPAGFLVDRVGGRTVMLGGLGLLAGGILLVGVAPTFALVVAALVVAGVGNSVFHPADLEILNHKVEPTRLGHAFGIHGVGGSIGWAAAPVFSIALASAYGWRAPLVVSGIGGLLVLAFLATQRILETHERGLPRPHASAPAPVRAVGLLASRPVLACFAFFALSSVALTGFQNYAIPVFDRIHHAPLAWASAALTAFLLGGALGYVMGGFLAASTGRHGAVTATGAIATAAMYVGMVIVGVGAPMLIALSAAAGIFLGTVTPSRDVMVRAVTPPQARGKVYGFVYSGLDLGASIAPPVFGWMMDYDFPATVFASMAGVMVLAALLVGEMSRHPAAERRTIRA